MTWSLRDRIKIWSQYSFYLFCFTRCSNELIKDFSREEFMTLSKNGESSKPKTTRSVGLVMKDNSLTKGPSLIPSVFHHHSTQAPTIPKPPQPQTGYWVSWWLGLRPKSNEILTREKPKDQDSNCHSNSHSVWVMEKILGNWKQNLSYYLLVSLPSSFNSLGGSRTPHPCTSLWPLHLGPPQHLTKSVSHTRMGVPRTLTLFNIILPNPTAPSPVLEASWKPQPRKVSIL